METHIDKYRRAPGLGKGHGERMLRYGQSLGMNLAELIHGTTLCSDFLDDSYDISPLDELVIASNILKRASHPFAEGFKLGLTYRITDLGLFGMAIMSSKNGAHAANIAQRYLQKAYNFTDMRLQIERNKIKLILKLSMQLDEELSQFILARDFGITYVVQSYFLNRRENNAYEVGFSLPYLNGMDLVAKTFGCPVKHNQMDSYVLSDIDQLLAEPPFSNEVNAKALEENYQQALQVNGAGTPSLSQRISDYLIQHSMSVQKKEVAKVFHMSERTLTRHLEKEEITWRALMSQVRLEKAEILLRISAKPLQKIAEEVGFSSLSSFSHAFTKHKGISPSEFRKLIEATMDYSV